MVLNKGTELIRTNFIFYFCCGLCLFLFFTASAAVDAATASEAAAAEVALQYLQGVGI